MDIVARFSHTPERRLILNCFLDYRAAIHQIGLNNGFQWLDGSFLEAVENSQNRPPRDVVQLMVAYPCWYMERILNSINTAGGEE
ncbi:MAG: hypothetical protein ABFS56_33570 [Pseudomonadota bacterium]